MKHALPLIAITMGDPAGVGPELCLKAAADPAVLKRCRPVIIGDRCVLESVAGRLGLALPEAVLTMEEASKPEALAALKGAALVDCGALAGERIEPGLATRAGGEACYRYILYAIKGATAGLFAGVTTAPITKATLHMAGIEEPGHTEIFAKMTWCDNYAMMLYSERIAVGLVTIHQSLASVPAALTTEAIARVTALTGQTLRAIRDREPRLAILGLNPHAGEGGLFGDEEARLIAPAVEQARREGWQVEGPLPPDAAFMPHNLSGYDGHVVMYHDQGLIPFKMISLHDGVNITMGLPIVRTSPDHGTAYDIAWQGKASPSSLIAAIDLAARMAGKK